MPTTSAVVAIKYSRTLSPVRRNCSRFSLAAKPRIMEAITSGITTIWISVRNSLPGSASYSPSTRPVVGANQPAEGPIAMPTRMPSTMPASTCIYMCADQAKQVGVQVFD